MRVLAIDPGDTASGYALIDSTDCSVIAAEKIDNQVLLARIAAGHIDADQVAIEMIASYGMPVGREVFDTCRYIGRLEERVLRYLYADALLVFRRDVKLHHCGSPRANDATITRALIDRFAPGERNYGKGTKSRPGWFFGFAKDVWQAYALAVLVADRLEGRHGA